MLYEFPILRMSYCGVDKNKTTAVSFVAKETGETCIPLCFFIFVICKLDDRSCCVMHIIGEVVDI